MILSVICAAIGVLAWDYHSCMVRIKALESLHQPEPLHPDIAKGIPPVDIAEAFKNRSRPMNAQNNPAREDSPNKPEIGASGKTE